MKIMWPFNLHVDERNFVRVSRQQFITCCLTFQLSNKMLSLVIYTGTQVVTMQKYLVDENIMRLIALILFLF